ncbi:MAG: hypothetical protein KC736_05075 [Candidatus Moranbacteria bacterium]|nr:hypothetical protein [Candidatus Moranbacteria bacterium]
MTLKIPETSECIFNSKKIIDDPISSVYSDNSVDDFIRTVNTQKYWVALGTNIGGEDREEALEYLNNPPEDNLIPVYPFTLHNTQAFLVFSDEYLDVPFPGTIVYILGNKQLHYAKINMKVIENSFPEFTNMTFDERAQFIQEKTQELIVAVDPF